MTGQTTQKSTATETEKCVRCTIMHRTKALSLPFNTQRRSPQHAAATRASDSPHMISSHTDKEACEHRCRTSRRHSSRFEYSAPGGSAATQHTCKGSTMKPVLAAHEDGLAAAAVSRATVRSSSMRNLSARAADSSTDKLSNHQCSSYAHAAAQNERRRSWPPAILYTGSCHGFVGSGRVITSSALTSVDLGGGGA